MKELVILKGNDVFTDSWVIAEGTGNSHEAVTKIINKYSDDFKEFGKLSSDLKSNKQTDKKSKIYLLNEPQATLLITYLRNTEKVRHFKKNLVSQFYKMRSFLMERQTQTWIETRQAGKLTRKAETDTIQKLVEYAKTQGSTHADTLYMTYSKLAKRMAGIESRDEASVMQLNNLSLMENIILHVIDTGILTGKYYKDIYQDCKKRLETVKDLAYIGMAV